MEDGMALPTPIKRIVPSLQISSDQKVTINIADLKAQIRSLAITVDGVPFEGSLEISLADLRKVLSAALAGIHVDEDWYISKVTGLGDDIAKGNFKSASEHYQLHGYLEGLLPEKPLFDE